MAKQIRKMSFDEAWNDFQASLRKTPGGGKDMGRVKKAEPMVEDAEVMGDDINSILARIDQSVQTLVDLTPKIDAILNYIEDIQEEVDDFEDAAGLDEPVDDFGGDMGMEDDFGGEEEFAEDDFDEDVELADGEYIPDEDEITKPEDDDDEVEKTEETDYKKIGTDRPADDDVKINDAVEEEIVEKTEEADYKKIGTDRPASDEVKIQSATAEVTLKKNRKGDARLIKGGRPKGIQKSQDAMYDDGDSVKEHLAKIGRVPPSEFKAPVRRR